MSRGGLAGSVCCCDCPPEECRLDCMFADLNYTATGTFNHSYYSVDCENGNYQSKSVDFSFIALGQPGYVLNRGSITEPEWVCKTPAFNPYSNNNISGGLSIVGSGSGFSEERSRYFGPDGPVTVIERYEYDVTWSSYGNSSSNFVDPGVSPTDISYSWDIRESNYNCDNEERCMVIIGEGWHLFGISVPSLSVVFKQTRTGRSIYQEYDSDGNLFFEEITPVSDENDYYFPYAHTHRILNNRVDCDGDIDPYELVEGNTAAMCQAMQDAFSLGRVLSQYPTDAQYVEADPCDQGEEQSPHLRTGSFADSFATGPCSDSVVVAVTTTSNVRATARSTIEEWGAANCPTP